MRGKRVRTRSGVEVAQVERHRAAARARSRGRWRAPPGRAAASSSVKRSPGAVRAGTRPRPARPRRPGSAARPRTASAVGWNCTNSMSSSAAPARRAMATPSPVATGGFVVSREDLARAARRQERRARQHHASRSPSLVEEAAADHAAVRDHQVGRAGEGAHVDRRRAARLLEQRAHHLPAGRVAQRVQHAVARVRALAREVEAARLAVEARAPGGQLADALRALLDQHPRRRRRRRCPRPPSAVSSRCRSVRVVRRPGPPPPRPARSRCCSRSAGPW